MGCVFCDRLAAGDLEAENELAAAFPDAFPLTRGHTLVVPRRHEADYFALTAAEQTAMWRLVNAVRARLERELHPDGYNLGVNVSQAAGLPRRADGDDRGAGQAAGGRDGPAEGGVERGGLAAPERPDADHVEAPRPEPLRERLALHDERRRACLGREAGDDRQGVRHSLAAADRRRTARSALPG